MSYFTLADQPHLKIRALEITMLTTMLQLETAAQHFFLPLSHHRGEVGELNRKTWKRRIMMNHDSNLRGSMSGTFADPFI